MNPAMGSMNHALDGVMKGMKGMDVYTKYIYFVLGAVLVVLIFWWLYRVITLIEIFLKAAKEVLGGSSLTKAKLLPFYNKEEVKGSYKGREVIVGVVYTGFKGEFLPLPFIQMRLKEAFGYNYNRLPNYATIEKNFLIYKVKLSVLWGVFDKNFPQVFSSNYLVIALEKLLSTAEDVERGRTVKEIFK